MSKIQIDEAVLRQAQQVPLHELLAKVPADARLVIEHEDGSGTSFIPVGRYCQEAATVIRQALEQPAPAQAWAGLTEEDKDAFWRADQMTGEEWDNLFAEVEANLKEKNTKGGA